MTVGLFLGPFIPAARHQAAHRFRKKRAAGFPAALIFAKAVDG
jgi:hypothetical protein